MQVYSGPCHGDLKILGLCLTMKDPRPGYLRCYLCELVCVRSRKLKEAGA